MPQQHNTHSNRGGARRQHHDNRGQRNHKPWEQRGINSLVIPETVAEAVRKADRASSPPIRLRAIGCDEYHSIGKVLVVRKAPIEDWRGHRDKILNAMTQRQKKRVAELVEQMCLEGTVLIDAVVLPERLGPLDKMLSLRQNQLEPGDRYEVVTIHRHRHSGVWFRTETHDGRLVEQCRSSFPLIGGYLGEDTQRGQRMIDRLARFCHMPIRVAEFSMFMQYRSLPLGQFHEIHGDLVEEREEAKTAVRPADIRAADELIVHAQSVAGYEHPPGSAETVIVTPERVQEIEEGREPYVLTSMVDLADAAEQAEAASAFDAAMAKAAEERRAKQEERELVGATAERPTLPAKAQRAAEMVRTAAASYAKPAPAPVQLPQQQSAPAPKPQGLPSWMTLPKRK